MANTHCMQQINLKINMRPWVKYVECGILAGSLSSSLLFSPTQDILSNICCVAVLTTSVLWILAALENEPFPPCPAVFIIWTIILNRVSSSQGIFHCHSCWNSKYGSLLRRRLWFFKSMPAKRFQINLAHLMSFIMTWPTSSDHCTTFFAHIFAQRCASVVRIVVF